ncbi:MAG: tRNA (N(6)-L-threonylcarbamoyladenosine(37)-C(2))-methylthiotransferase MtaB [Helicobacter sp.]|nr:tRNA (N(6)-L-threonylcarbamoyladenosine(37)-C(2))-methylthiotransferase MtaB [Helicobacter sp.]
MPRVFFKTFGCRTNLFDTAVMRSNLQHFAIASNEEEADIIIVNSCTVTNASDSGVRNYVRRAHTLGKKIFLTGCGATTQGKELFEQKLVFAVFSHALKEQIDSLLQSAEPFCRLLPETALDSTLVGDFVGKSRAFVKIQEGCDFACSYCIIPQVRGAARSFEPHTILEQIRLLASRGFSEFVLTGTNTGSYGRAKQDKDKPTLAHLIRKIAQIEGVRRIRIGSLEPSQIDSELFELLGESFMAKHLHIALQHTHNTMLEIMNRRNRFENDYEQLHAIARLGYAIGSDFIVGHPGETESIFAQALENLASLPLTHLHPFVYSPRNNTPSSTLAQTISGDVAKARLHTLKQLVDSNNYQFRQKLQAKGVALRVLVEGKDDSKNGLDQFFNRIHFKHMPVNVGDWVFVYNYQVKKEGNYA